ncbi:unnamed protein product [Schistosoma mattheei]|uniref:Uncharacterized protein n=1 Tax=Schistosoma mattheei TaxID=31246 RepID=A0A183PYD9_9TREM|nr:unnamed protein product [Schistosoma mattheei]
MLTVEPTGITTRLFISFTLLALNVIRCPLSWTCEAGIRDRFS